MGAWRGRERAWVAMAMGTAQEGEERGSWLGKSAAVPSQGATLVLLPLLTPRACASSPQSEPAPHNGIHPGALSSCHDIHPAGGNGRRVAAWSSIVWSRTKKQAPPMKAGAAWWRRGAGAAASARARPPARDAHCHPGAKGGGPAPASPSSDKFHPCPTTHTPSTVRLPCPARADRRCAPACRPPHRRRRRRREEGRPRLFQQHPVGE